MLRTRYRLLGGAIVLCWLVMTGLLVYHEVLRPRIFGLTAVSQSLRAQNVWMGVFLGDDQRVGFINMRTLPGHRDDGPGVQLHLNARLHLALLGSETRLVITGEAWRSNAHGFNDFDINVASGPHEMRIAGIARDGVLDARIETAGETIPLRFPVGEELLLSGGMALPALGLPALEPGQEVYVDTFDPTSLSMGRAHIECVGRETLRVAGEDVQTLRLATTIGGVTHEAWIREDGEVVQAKTAFGLTLRAITPDDALTAQPPAEAADLVQSLAIAPEGLRPVRGATRLAMHLSGLPEGVAPPTGPLQSFEHGVLTITAPAAPGDVAPEPLSPEDRAEALSSDPFITSDHPRIRAAALEAVGDATDPWAQALRLHDWLYETIEKTPVISVPSALDVLRTREGDCNEHSVLYAALARSLGIPCRVAIGLVWSDTLGGFGYHAWPEVYVGSWVPLDPTLGQPIADATHLKVLHGSVEQWTRLLPYIGQLRIEVTTVDAPEAPAP